MTLTPEYIRKKEAEWKALGIPAIEVQDKLSIMWQSFMDQDMSNDLFPSLKGECLHMYERDVCGEKVMVGTATSRPV